MYVRIKQRSRILFLSFCCFFIQATVFYIVLPDQAQAQTTESINLSLKQKNFLNSTHSATKPVFAKIQVQREKIKALQKYYTQQGLLSLKEGAWLQQIALEYRYPSFNYQVKEDWEQLLQRVDTVPDSLLLAQAAIESAWGTSRFATQGNAYFGQRCNVSGCGLKALKADFLTKKFTSKQASIQAYVWNLNTHGAYEAFRKERALMRKNHQALDSLILVKQLIAYAETGEGYIRDTSNLIKALQLQKHYDVKTA